MSNSQVVANGFKAFKQRLEQQLLKALVETAKTLLLDALDKREYQSFTGNTVTSYACGIFYKGELIQIVEQSNRMAEPVHAKIQNGQLVWLDNPYEGLPRSVRGKVNITYNASGVETSKALLSSASVDKSLYTVRMLTGTEYSQYLENVYNMNVLSDTAIPSNVSTIATQNIKNNVR